MKVVCECVWTALLGSRLTERAKSHSTFHFPVGPRTRNIYARLRRVFVLSVRNYITKSHLVQICHPSQARETPAKRKANAITSAVCELCVLCASVCLCRGTFGVLSLHNPRCTSASIISFSVYGLAFIRARIRDIRAHLTCRRRRQRVEVDGVFPYSA